MDFDRMGGYGHPHSTRSLCDSFVKADIVNSVYPSATKSLVRSLSVSVGEDAGLDCGDVLRHDATPCFVSTVDSSFSPLVAATAPSIYYPPVDISARPMVFENVSALGGSFASNFVGVQRKGTVVSLAGIQTTVVGVNEPIIQVGSIVRVDFFVDSRKVIDILIPVDVAANSLVEFLEDYSSQVDAHGEIVCTDREQAFISKLHTFGLYSLGLSLKDSPLFLAEFVVDGRISIDIRLLNLGGSSKHNKDNPPPRRKKAGGLVTRAEGKKVVKEIKGVVKSVLRGAGQAGGAYIGNMVGNSQGGAQVGDAIARRISRIMGSGDYEMNDSDITGNSLIKGNRGRGGGNSPSFATSHDSVRVKHREYLLDISTPPTCGGFTIQGLTINPGNPVSFPYLYAIAQRFEQYRFHGLVFEFVPTTSPYNSFGAMGNNIFACEYNSTSAPYASKVEMENSNNSISARFDKGMLYGVECASQAQTLYYVRNDSDSATPVNLTDLCDFYYAMQTASTFPPNSVVGELWVTYDVELCKPIYSQSGEGYARYTIAVAPGGLGSTVTSPLSVVGTTVNVDGALTSPVGRGSLALTGARETPLYLFTPYVSYTGSSFASGATAINFFNLRVGDTLRVELTMSGTFPTGTTIPSGGPIATFTNLDGSSNKPDDSLWLSPSPYTYSGLTGTTPVYLLQQGFVNLATGAAAGGNTPFLLVSVQYVTIRKNAPGSRPILYIASITSPSALVVTNYACNLVVQFAGRAGQDF